MVFTVPVPPLPVPASPMPARPLPPDRAGWSRRRLLGAAGLTGVGLAGALGSLSACSADRSDPPPPRPPDPLDPFVAASRTLADQYQAAIASHPELTDRLGPLHATHVAHVAALLLVTGRPEASPGAEPTTGEDTTAGADTGRTPTELFAGHTPAETVAALREAEQVAQVDAEAACLAAPADRAALLGSIAAARACHAAELT